MHTISVVDVETDRQQPDAKRHQRIDEAKKKKIRYRTDYRFDCFFCGFSIIPLQFCVVFLSLTHPSVSSQGPARTQQQQQQQQQQQHETRGKETEQKKKKKKKK